MELLVKPEMLTSYIYGPTFDNSETVSFYLLHNVSTLNQCREVAYGVICFTVINLLKPNDMYICRVAALTSRRYILNIYSTNIHNGYFKHAA